jgi:hypothetical protein
LRNAAAWRVNDLLLEGVFDISLLPCALDCACRTPERPPGIDPVRIELQHLIVQLLRGCCRSRKAVEIPDVPPGLFDDPGIVVVFGSLVGRNNCAWVERFNLIERRDPLPSCLNIRLAKPNSNATIKETYRSLLWFNMDA